MKYVFSLILLIGLQVNSYSQQSEKILNNLFKAYDKYVALYAELDFSQAGEGQNLDISGKCKMYIQEDKYNITQDKLQFISNGDLSWTISNSEEEITIAYLEDKKQEGEGLFMPNTNFFFRNWNTGFNSSIVGEETKDGVVLTKINLTPSKGMNMEYESVLLKVDTNKNELYSIYLVSEDGMNIEYIIRSFEGNPNIPKGTFQLNETKYPGFHLNDLR